MIGFASYAQAELLTDGFRVRLGEAKTRLSEFVAAALRGQEVVIAL